MRGRPGDWLAITGSMVGREGSHPRAQCHRDNVEPARPAVVAGLDGSARSLAAARWAAAEASGRALPLRLVCAIDPADSGVAPASRDELHRGASAMVETVRVQLHEAHPDVEIVSSVIFGTPAQALVQTVGPVEMICVGASVPAPPHPGHHASTVTEIILDSDCPVVVVTTDPPARGWVVTELNSEPSADDMLRLAVEEALLRQVPLRLLIGSHTPAGLPGDHRADLCDRMERSLDRWREVHPELDALVVSTDWSLEQYLRRYQKKIALFVAPPRQVHDIGTILHSTAETALRLLDCPVTLYADAGGAASMPTVAHQKSMS